MTTSIPVDVGSGDGSAVLPGELVLSTEAGEILLLSGDKIFHRGKLLTTDPEIVEGLRDLIRLVQCGNIHGS